MVLSTLEIVPPRATVWRSRPWEVVTAQPALQLGSGAGVCRRVVPSFGRVDGALAVWSACVSFVRVFPMRL